jgi:hypothetical protein
VSNFGLALIYLKQALQQAGCPICRCCFDHETHYLKFLLWENVNDVETRVRLAQSLGFCGRHARQMLQMEREDLGMMLGNSIIYESLIHLVLLKVRDVRSFILEQRAQRDWMSKLLGGLGIKLPHRYSKGQSFLAPDKGCRVCELSDETARHYGDVLAEMLSYDRFRDLYDRSDGVCLPHLRVMLQVASLSPGLEYLLSKTEKRLEILRDDLRGLSQKYSVSHRNEPVTVNESLSVEQAIAFLTGSTPPQSTKG